MSQSTPKPLVVVAEHLDAAAFAWLGERCEVVACAANEKERFAGLLARASGLVGRTYTRVDASLLAKAPKLRVVGRAGVGLDNIDVGACRGRGVEVVHTPDANTQAVVEYVFAMLHDAVRPRVFLDQPLANAEWERVRRELIAPRQMSEMTMGVWGLGRIGKHVARAAAGLGMDVLYNDLVEIEPEERHGATPVSREELLRTSDILTLHVDPREANRGLLGADALALCKPTVFLVNTSRGMVIDAGALGAFLSANPRATALIDVHEPEPIVAGYPLLGLANAHLSPHIAAATATAHANMSWVVRDVDRVLRGQPPVHAAP
ncbi:MAG: hypothetical protein JSR77_13775 [Planctomycetes bacterium]|nr:hypothetical protein [Planctomycetota bacterium]